MSELHAPPMRPFEQRRELVLVHAFEGHRIDLHLEPGRLRRIDAGQNLAQFSPARDGAEFVGVERIE